MGKTNRWDPDSTHYGTAACPKCREKGQDRKGDNLALYSDGHKHCFACGFHVGAHGLMAMKAALLQAQNDEKVKEIKLPSDATHDIDFIAKTWLSYFEIYSEEVRENELLWSPSKQMLIFPFYETPNDTDVKAWQGRCFKEGYSRYYTCGDVENIFWFHKLNEHGKRGIILVEDCVSAMKVGRHACTLPLLGSSLSASKRMRLKHMSDTLIFWLDYDKVDAAYKYSAECQAIGYKTKVIVTKEDPKYYDDLEIKEILEGIGY